MLCISQSYPTYDQRAKSGISVGYPYAQNDYWIFELENHRVFTSYDVQFFKHVLKTVMSLPHFHAF